MPSVRLPNRMSGETRPACVGPELQRRYNSPRTGSDLQRSATNNRDKIARRMTPAQIAEAKRLTQQCQARQFKGC
jgi:hypothetical protein